MADGAGRNARRRRDSLSREPAAFPMSDGQPTDAEVARSIGVTPPTLRRWVDDGVVPKDGTWTPAAIAHARIVARLRERGHTLRQIAAATEAGRLSFAYIED